MFFIQIDPLLLKLHMHGYLSNLASPQFEFYVSIFGFCDYLFCFPVQKSVLLGPARAGPGRPHRAGPDRPKISIFQKC